MDKSQHSVSLASKLSAKRKTVSSSSTSSCEDSPRQNKNMADTQLSDLQVKAELSSISHKLENICTSQPFINTVKSVFDEPLNIFTKNILDKIDEKIDRYKSRVHKLEMQNTELEVEQKSHEKL